ncbi:hypothetical protein BC830DRAFT_1065941 [Chytriomyces sp. MP71]|nr:hypothetical protein BC830DRAFT_1065941 [Chytriomyces sp. MP71]
MASQVGSQSTPVVETTPTTIDTTTPRVQGSETPSTASDFSEESRPPSPSVVLPPPLQLLETPCTIATETPVISTPSTITSQTPGVQTPPHSPKHKPKRTSTTFSTFLNRLTHPHLSTHHHHPHHHQYAAEELEPATPVNVPAIAIVIHIVGSRGDVQPFIVLAKELQRHGHRVRIATHAVFRSFVLDNGIEFYPLAGDPEELMAYMVKNPGLLPGMESIRAGDIHKKRVMIKEILESTYHSCIDADPEDPQGRPFVADAIISNPPAFGHIHCAQKLGIPLHIFFTMPWTQTHAFPHPLTKMTASTPHMNHLSYDLVELMTWEALRDIINAFRRSLNLPRLGTSAAVPLLRALRVPHTYMWSRALLPKPADWGAHVDVSGFMFLPRPEGYAPPPELVRFLREGDRPVYIGFGSIVVDDPDAMTRLVFEAVEKAGVRAIVSKGWGGLGDGRVKVPENVYLVGNCPHDWLFAQVAGVVHHGGAGTTAAGLRAGKPTFIVPFFGDQPFWGSMVDSIHAGPKPIPYKHLTVPNFSEAITSLFGKKYIKAAEEASRIMVQEDGSVQGVASFHRHIAVHIIACDIDPSRMARYHVPSTGQNLSEEAVEELVNSGSLQRSDLHSLTLRDWSQHDHFHTFSL